MSGSELHLLSENVALVVDVSVLYHSPMGWQADRSFWTLPEIATNQPMSIGEAKPVAYTGILYIEGGIALKSRMLSMAAPSDYVLEPIPASVAGARVLARSRTCAGSEAPRADP